MVDGYGDAGLDAELERRVAAQGRIAASLVELEGRPGHRLLSAGPLTGLTAQRWSAARDTLAGLWQDFGRYQDVLAAAGAVRAGRARPGVPERGELRRLLVEPSVEVGRRVVDRGLTGAVEDIETITLEQLTARMDVAFRELDALVDICENLHQSFLTGLVPIAERLHALRAVDGDAEAVAALTAEVEQLDRACATDPLSLRDRPPADVLAALETRIAALGTSLARVAAVRSGWTDLLAGVTAAVAEVEALQERERHARQRAEELVLDPVPAPPPDRVPALRRELAALQEPGGWPARAVALDELHAAAAAAVREVNAAMELSAGLLDRRTELRGRFEAFRAKATRLGHAERPDLLVLDEDIRRLLWTRPSDLAAATRALAAYQRGLSGAGSSGSGATGRSA